MLDAALAATETDDGVTLSLRIENAGSKPVTLRFRTGQRAEFTAFPTDDGRQGGDGTGGPDETGDSVWRYGATRMFTQALGSETLAPGESVSHGATWRDPPAGTYRIVAEASAVDRDVRAEAVVTVR